MRMTIFIFIVLITSGCVSIKVPPEYTHKIIKTKYFDITSWQKITSPDNVYKIYIEGDGHAFYANGLPSSDPTPHGTLMRELAFHDPNANIVYLARPCQYQTSAMCSQKYWTTGRFAKEVIESEYEAIKSIVGHNDVILIGFSGGGAVASLIGATKNDIKVKKLVTIAGNLDHKTWTTYHHLPPLKDSMDLRDYYSQFILIYQLHYVGLKDKVVPYQLTQEFIKNDNLLIRVVDATHNDGWQEIYQNIWQER